MIYIYVPQVRYIGMIDVYDKDEADDLSPEERRILAEIADNFRDDLLAESET